jgi:predicted esterase
VRALDRCSAATKVANAGWLTGHRMAGSGNLAAIAAECGPVPLPGLEAEAATFSALGLIDPISNLAHRFIYVYHGLADAVVAAPVAGEGVQFHQHLRANVEYDGTSLAGERSPAR